ncbi:MAG TPA: DOMON-like domain-containing protein [Steroidobacteraceae bacterium]|nr:DOMON-like domain-containing protein [Steroidobacteraceae bacterium]
MTDASFHSLVAHPNTPSRVVRRIAASAELAGPDVLRFRYVLEADLQQVRVPPPAADAARADNLWAHTCFEAFVSFALSPRYLELNFSTSGQWAAYGFESHRQHMAAVDLRAPPRLTLRRSDERLDLQAEVAFSGALLSLGTAPDGVPGRLRIALSTVVEDREGRLSYWALCHPPGRPDFHHTESFALTLELPATP